MDYATSAYMGLSVTMLLIFGVMFVVYFVLLLVGGIMLYYFTGSKPGHHILKNMMNFAARFYTNIWMLLTSFLAALGLGLLFKVIIGALFSGFAYSEAISKITRGVNPRTYDLQLGLVLTLISLLIFAVHFGFNWMIETKAQRKGTVLSKGFVGLGLFLSSMWFFGVLIVFVMELISYANRTGALSSVYPGANLSVLMASFPLWLYYAGRAVWMIRKEK